MPKQCLYSELEHGEEEVQMPKKEHQHHPKGMLEWNLLARSFELVARHRQHWSARVRGKHKSSGHPQHALHREYVPAKGCTSSSSLALVVLQMSCQEVLIACGPVQ